MQSKTAYEHKLDAMTEHTEEEGFYTVREAARSLKVCESTVWRWIDSGTLPAYRIGHRKTRIKRTDLRSVVAPVKAREKREMLEGETPMRFVRMSAMEAEDQEVLLAASRAAQACILKRRGGQLLPASWEEINEAREKRSDEL